MEAKFKELIHTYRPSIFKICLGFVSHPDEADDLYQEVCIQIWKGLPRFEGRSSYKTWIYRVSMNVCLMHKRKKRAPDTVSNEKVAHKLGNWEELEKQEKDEKVQLLYACIRKLPEKDRVLCMLFLEDLSYKEMAEISGLTVNHIGVRMNRIRQKLKTTFINYGRI